MRKSVDPTAPDPGMPSWLRSRVEIPVWEILVLLVPAAFVPLMLLSIWLPFLGLGYLTGEFDLAEGLNELAPIGTITCALTAIAYVILAVREAISSRPRRRADRARAEKLSAFIGLDIDDPEGTRPVDGSEADRKNDGTGRAD